MASASSACSSTTSTSRWVSLLTKSAWSRWAFSTHMTSSKSSSSLLLGVSLRCASPGAQTSTLRSRPTSEWTPYVEEMLSVIDGAFLSWSEGDAAGPQPHGADDPSGDDEREDPDLGRGKDPALVLAARLDVEQRGRCEDHGHQEHELHAGRVEEEDGVR